MPDKEVIVYKKKCPVCQRPSISARWMQEGKEKENAALWYSCTCGIMYQPDPPSYDVKNKKYIAKYLDTKEYKDIGKYKQRIYIPIVEELTYGRKMLDVGYTTHLGMDKLKKRGWINKS